MSSYAEGGEEYDIRMRADAPFRADAERLALSRCLRRSTAPSRSHSVVTMKRDERARRRSTGSAGAGRSPSWPNSAPGVGDSAVQTALDKIIADQHLPAGYTAVAGWAARRTRRARLRASSWSSAWRSSSCT